MTIAEAERALRDAKIAAALAEPWNAKLVNERGRCPRFNGHFDRESFASGLVVGAIIITLIVAISVFFGVH